MARFKRRGPLSWVDLLEAYDRAHSRRANRIANLIAITMMVLAVPVASLSLRLAAQLVIAGLILQFAGHYLLPGQAPPRARDRRNLLVGVVWAGREWARLLSTRRPKRSR